MILSYLLGSSGPIWAEIAAAILDKALVTGVLFGFTNNDKLKKAYQDITTNVDSTVTNDDVINVFDIDK